MFKSPISSLSVVQFSTNFYTQFRFLWEKSGFGFQVKVNCEILVEGGLFKTGFLKKFYGFLLIFLVNLKNIRFILKLAMQPFCSVYNINLFEWIIKIHHLTTCVII